MPARRARETDIRLGASWPAPSRRMSLPEFTLLPDGLPAIPRRHRSVGPEPLAHHVELLRCRQLPQAVRQRVAFANAVVPHRPHVEPPQLEDHEHLGGAPTAATHNLEARKTPPVRASP